MLRSTEAFIFLVLFFPFHGQAADSCLAVKECVNTYEASVNSSMGLVKSFCATQQGVTTESSCNGDCDGISKWISNSKDLKKISTAIQKTGQRIKLECINASLKRAINNGYICNSESSKPVAAGKDACVSNQMATFYQTTINDGIACLNSLNGGIDPKVILQKMNNESGFNPQLSSRAGIGIGQLVPVSIRELLGTKKGEGGGRDLIQSIASSNAGACSPFKNILQKDLKTMPPLPNMTKKRNLCPYISFDGGFQRNTILSLALFTHYRKQILSVLKSRNIKAQPPTIGKLTLAAYSRYGPREVRAYLESIREGASVSDLAVTKRFAYITEVENKMTELNCIKKFGSQCRSPSFRRKKKWTDDERSGAACIE